MKSIISLLRPHQYIKNVFIFLPLFFSVKITNTELFLNAFIAFIAFSFSASAVYILNDYFDIEQDRLHPKKKFRPLASGLISKKNSLFIMFLLAIVGSVSMFMLSIDAGILLCSYFAINLTYSYYLKIIPLLDILIISLGFVLRLYIGSVTTFTPLSNWIIALTIMLALFLGLAKRRDDVLIFISSGKKIRHSVEFYNLKILDTLLLILAAIIIVTYLFYTISDEVVLRATSNYLFITLLFVISGIFRYLRIIFIEKNSGSPTRVVLEDKFMQIAIVGWLISFVWFIY